MSIESEKRRLRKALDKGEDLPAHYYEAAAPRLRQPFAPEAVQFRVWEAWAGDGGTSLTHAHVVPYVDARAVIARLNVVCPMLWAEVPPNNVNSGASVIAMRRYSEGEDEGVITHWDIGEGAGKALRSDALKRAAVHFGVGESLYAVPTIELTTTDPIDQDDDEGPLLREWAEWVDGKLKPTLRLTRAGENYCRDIYRRWLLAHGIAAFGRPLDHGNLTAPSEMPITGPPMPVAAKRKTTPDKATRYPMPAQIPTDTITPDATPEDKLEVLLSVKEDGLQPQRRAIAATIQAHWPDRGAAFILKEIQGAEKDREGARAGLDRKLLALANVTNDIGTSEP